MQTLTALQVRENIANGLAQVSLLSDQQQLWEVSDHYAHWVINRMIRSLEITAHNNVQRMFNQEIRDYLLQQKLWIYQASHFTNVLNVRRLYYFE